MFLLSDNIFITFLERFQCYFITFLEKWFCDFYKLQTMYVLKFLFECLRWGPTSLQTVKTEQM